MIKNLIGMHHVTAITSNAEKNYEFFTYTLGMRLVKKTVNQDDIQTYHLFFADDEGNAGTDMTFFDFPGIQKGKHGTNEIYRTSFRVPSDAALDYWVKRFDRLGVKHTGIEQQFDVKVLAFEDFDEQQYQLVSDETNTGRPSGKPWEKGPVPNEFATEGPGFQGDEPYETLGEKLSLPPFFEHQREEIESLVRPIDTVRSTKTFEKEYE